MEDRVHEVRAALMSLEGDMFALSDDLWLDVEHNDSDAVRSGAELKVAFNAIVESISKALTDFNALLPKVRTEQRSSSVADIRSDLEDPFAERKPHHLREDFRRRSPFGFALAGNVFARCYTWRALYETLLRSLANRDPALFSKLPDEPAFISSQQNKYFSHDSSELRKPLEISGSVFAEVNFSTEEICRRISRLLTHFGVRPEEFSIYLRND